ncbi:hypothetical protein BC834DRAFT_626285 [Gloeopeniophorella convolvens]|nr:hypothetical protein BC834DRAFT_626285 [Gloeopeniophorella convolvens]
MRASRGLNRPSSTRNAFASSGGFGIPRTSVLGHINFNYMHSVASGRTSITHSSRQTHIDSLNLAMYK